MTIRLVVLADRIIAPLRSSDRAHLAPTLRLTERALAQFENAPIVLLGFRRQELLDIFSGCLFLNNPARFTTRTPETYLECLKYIPSHEDVLFVEADADLSPDALASVAAGVSGLLYTPSLAKPHAKLTSLFVRAEQREHVEAVMRTAGSDQDGMIVRLESELPILMVRPSVSELEEARALKALAYYDQQ